MGARPGRLMKPARTSSAIHFEPTNSQMNVSDSAVVIDKPSVPASGSTIEFRRATIEDIDALLALESRCFRSVPYKGHRFNASQFRYYLLSTRAFIFIANNRRGMPIANLIAVSGGGARSHLGRILSLAVIARERRKGVGRGLLAQGIETLRARGCIRIHLEVAERATQAQTLFRSMGFKRTRSLPNYYGPSLHGVRLVLDTGSSGF